MRLLLPALCALVVSATTVLAQVPADAKAQTRLLRFPTTNGSQIVFTYAGNLYTVGMDGGTARRLTSTTGYNSFPRFSADGKMLAFTAQYDGNTEVSVMPADGGEPKRLTFTATLGRDDISDRMGPNNIVLGWKNLKPEIAFRSRMRTFNDFNGQLYTVGLNAELPQQLPVPRGGFLSFSPDDSKMAYNRVFREFRTWKRYRGGMADDIWIFDFKTGALENITNNEAQDIIPMWAPNNKIYFLSDRDGHMNLFSYDLATKKTAQHTTFKDYDIKFPSLGQGGIVFEQAGYIWHFDLTTEKARQVPIAIHEDFASGRAATIDASKFITSVHPSPDGKRVVVGARGEIFSAPLKDGPIRNLTNSTGVHERDATWSPDGKWIAYVSDESGETEIWVRPQDGKGAPVQLTTKADTYYYRPVWSPDSKKLMWSDRLQRLRFVDVDTKAVTEVDHDKLFEIREYTWSPDSKWISYSRPEEDSLPKIWLYSVDSKKRIEVTDGWYDSESPAFSDDGKYLLFTSSRDFRPLYGLTEFNHIYRDMERVYAVTLAKDTDSPLKPKSDEVEIVKDEKKDDAKKDPKVAETKDDKSGDGNGKDDKKDAKPKKPVVVKVDEDGLKDRLVALPIAPANYDSIQTAGDKIYYLRATVGDENTEETPNPDNAPSRTFAFFDLKERKETELGRFDAYEITADGKKMLVKSKKEYAIIDLPKAKIELKDKLKLEGLDMRLDHHAEWKQIFNESWRQMRDFFYAPNMHGVDWPAMREKYGALLPYVNNRNDLTYLIGEMIGELNIGHSYVGGGERPESPRIKLGLLGAEFSRDPGSKAYRIDKILPGENWSTRGRSPLTEIGVNIKEGDYILAVNGQPVDKLENLFDALVGAAGKQIVLKVNSKPVEAGSREVTVIPTADEAALYYNAWVQHNIDYVSKKTGGKIGYVHIPDMGRPGLNEFARRFYPQIRKSGLIVDVRGNGGGNVSPMIIERLRRELIMVNISRNSVPRPNPNDMLVGPVTALMDEFSASDGDIFPYRFKTLGMGKLIGKRSWGGVVGIRGTLPLTDGGYLNRPEFAPYSKDGNGWVIEGHGVDPDIVVDNDPAHEFKGDDQQLDKAIEVILEELKTKGKDLPPVPPYPKKN
jgi:tricorn protease